MSNDVPSSNGHIEWDDEKRQSQATPLIKNDKPFTVFLCGTASKTSYVAGDPESKKAGYPSGELVANLAKKLFDTVPEFISGVAFNGVGFEDSDYHKYPITPTMYSSAKGLAFGYGSDQIALAVRNFAYGFIEPNRIEGLLDPSKSPRLPFPDDAKQISDLDEEYYSEQVKTIILAWRTQKINEVNLVGWSRGGWNAIQIAHRLQAENPAIKVNILSFDPVPGPGINLEESSTLPPNVQRYVSFISMDEHTKFFQPVIPVKPNHSMKRYQIYTIPGGHATLVGGISNDSPMTPDELKPLADLVRREAENTLVEFGVYPEGSVSTPVDEESWKEVARHRKVYEKLKFERILPAWSKVRRKFVSDSPVLGTQSLEDDNSNEILDVWLRQVKLGGETCFIEEVPTCRHNPPHLCDLLFGIEPDLCSFHRLHNDALIVERFEDVFQDMAPEGERSPEILQALYSLKSFLQQRYVSAIDDTQDSKVQLKDSIERVNQRIGEILTLYVESKLGSRDEYFDYINAIIEKSIPTHDIFYLAAEKNYIDQDLLITLLEHTKVQEQERAVFVATEHGNVEFIQALSHFASQRVGETYHLSLSIRNKQGLNILELAAQKGHLRLVKYLYDQTKINAHLTLDAFFIANKNGQTEVAEFLFKNLHSRNIKKGVVSPEEAQVLKQWIAEKPGLVDEQQRHSWTQHLDHIINHHQATLPVKPAPIPVYHDDPDFRAKTAVSTGVLAFAYGATTLTLSLAPHLVTGAAAVLFVATGMYTLPVAITLLLCVVAVCLYNDWKAQQLPEPKTLKI